MGYGRKKRLKRAQGLASTGAVQSPGAGEAANEASIADGRRFLRAIVRYLRLNLPKLTIVRRCTYCSSYDSPFPCLGSFVTGRHEITGHATTFHETLVISETMFASVCLSWPPVQCHPSPLSSTPDGGHVSTLLRCHQTRKSTTQLLGPDTSGRRAYLSPPGAQTA